MALFNSDRQPFTLKPMGNLEQPLDLIYMSLETQVGLRRTWKLCAERDPVNQF